MIAYVIGVLPLIWELRDAHPCVTQPWYDDDAGAGGGGRSSRYRRTFRICKRRDQPRDITRSQSRASWSWPQGMSHRLRSISGD